MNRNFGVTRRVPLTSRGNSLLPDMALEEPPWLAEELRWSARRQRAREGARAFFWWTAALAVSLSTLVALQRGLLTWLVGL